MEGFDLYTIVFLVLAVFILFRLRSVLGQRTGNERPPSERRRNDTASSPVPANDKVIPLPQRGGAAPDGPVEPVGFRWKGLAEEGSALASGLDAILAADRSFDAAGFSQGAKAAYEMIVNAFNDGDRKTLKSLLSREVFDSFASAINEREQRGETIEGSFVSLDEAKITEAGMKGKSAQVTVRFVSKMISATRNKAGDIIEGSLEKITEVTDVWTFARDVSSNDPNWRLVAAEDE